MVLPSQACDWADNPVMMTLARVRVIYSKYTGKILPLKELKHCDASWTNFQLRYTPKGLSRLTVDDRAYSPSAALISPPRQLRISTLIHS